MTTHAQIEVADGVVALLGIGKALSDRNRVRILGALAERELCVCDLVDLLGIDASTVSRHVSVLRRTGLVSVHKEGRWLHCGRSDIAPTLWAAIDEFLEGSPEIESDAAWLAQHCSDC